MQGQLKVFKAVLPDLSGFSGMDLSNMLKQELAPAIVKAAEAIVPKTNCSTETVRDE
jgi:hypothetical protein